MGKRAAAAKPKAAPVPKRARVDAAQQLCGRVARALYEAEDLPASAKQMLRDMLEPSLLAYKDQRHRYQAEIVGMVSEVLTSTEARLQKAVERSEATVAEEAGARQQLEEVVHEADARLKEQEEELRIKKYALADCARTFKAAKSSLQEAQAALETFEQELGGSASKRTELQAAMELRARPLLEGTAQSEEASEMLEELMATLNKLGLDEGMLAALPSALSKAPDARGNFDSVVIKRLQEEVERQLAALERGQEEADSTRAALTESCKEAKVALDEATAAQQASAETFVASRDERDSRAMTLGEAQQALRKHQAEMKRHARELQAAGRHLQAFREGPMAAFAELRDRTSPAEAEQEPEATPAEAATTPEPPVVQAAQEAATVAA